MEVEIDGVVGVREGFEGDAVVLQGLGSRFAVHKEESRVPALSRENVLDDASLAPALEDCDGSARREGILPDLDPQLGR